MRKGLLLSVLFALIASAAGAQTPEVAARIAEIDRQVWIPFVEGVNTDVAELYVGVHSADFYWVAPGPKGRVMDLREYDDDSRTVMKRRKDEGLQTQIELRFLERNVKPKFAAEKVILKATMLRDGKAPEVAYGIAQYFLRKEAGGWKVLLRYGSSEKATAEMFEAAQPLAR